MRNKLLSRKFLLSVVGAFLVIANQGMGWNLPEESVNAVAAVIIAYVLGESYIDAKK